MKQRNFITTYAVFLLVGFCQSNARHQSDLHNIRLPPVQSEKLARLFLGKNVAIQIEFNQDDQSECVLFSLEHQPPSSDTVTKQVFFQLSASTIQNHVKLDFLLDTGQHKVFTIGAPLNDGKFHNVVMVLDGNTLTVVDNCRRLFTTNDPDLAKFGSSEADFSHFRAFVGEQHSGDGTFKGRMKQFTADAGSPLEAKCPNMEVVLDNRVNVKLEPLIASKLPPTVGIQQKAFGAKQRDSILVSSNSDDLARKVDHLQDQVNHWSTVFQKFESRIKKVELVQRGCQVSGKLISVGERLQNHANCTECQCSATGQLHCGAIGCPKLDCLHPAHPYGKCCPECGRECYYNGQHYENGVEFWPKQCVNCKCDNGRMECQFRRVENCPVLDCPQQDTPPNQCCPVCTNIDYCAPGRNPCHEKASCESGPYSALCKCKEGYFGNGTRCYDIDECLWDESAREQLGGCRGGTVCINLPGSFKCDCLPGYQQIDQRNCLDVIRV